MLWFHNLLRIYYYLVDCTWSGWQRWSKCDSVCGGGIRSRYRPVKFQSMGRGSKCKIKDRTEIEGCSKSLCTSTTSTTMITTPRSRYNLSRIDPSVCDHFVVVVCNFLLISYICKHTFLDVANLE